jgi:hypothetical protein
VRRRTRRIHTAKDTSLDDARKCASPTYLRSGKVGQINLILMSE